MSDFSTRARVVHSKAEAQRLNADLAVRPMRLAFVIRDDLPWTGLAEILETNSEIWGGYYNCLVPSDGEMIEDRWWAQLVRHHPDKVVFCGSKGRPVVAPELMRSVGDRIQPFSLHEWDLAEEKKPAREQNLEADIFGCVPMVYPLRYLVDSLKEPVGEEPSNVRLPSIERTHPFYLPVAAQVGIARGGYEEGYREILKAKHVVFDSADMESYLECLGQFHGHLCPLDFTHRDLRVTLSMESEDRPEGLTIVLASDRWLPDVCLFWNLRLSPSFAFLGARYEELLLPVGSLRSERSLKALASACNAFGAWATRRVTLLSIGVERRRLTRLADRLRQHMGGGASVQVLRDPLPIANFRVTHKDERDQVMMEDSRFSFKRLTPEFEPKHGEWVIDLDLKDISNRSYEFPKSSKLNAMLCCSPDAERISLRRGYWIRYPQDALACRVNERTSYVNGCLVSSFDAFEASFRDKGFEARVTDKCRYVEGFLELLGSQGGIRLLAVEGIRQMLWYLRDGKDCTIDVLKEQLKLGADCERAIEDLVDRRILLRGMSFRCEACGLRHWYPISGLDETMQCIGCLKHVRLPVGAPVMFRLNELADRAVQQGALPVLLAQRLLSRHTLKRALVLAGVEVKKDGQRTDIDIVTTLEGYLLLAECKEFKDSATPKQIKDALAQLSRLVNLAVALGAPVVLLGTLLSTVPLELASGVLRLHRKQVAVHLVRLHDEKVVDLHNPTQSTDWNVRNLFPS